MENQKYRQEGGLILPRFIIETMLNYPDTKGVAFACKVPGKAPNVDLKILRVYEKNGVYKAEPWSIAPKHKSGATNPSSHRVGKPDDFRFHYHSELEADKYVFGFYENFNHLFKGRGNQEWDEIFIGGGRQSYAPGIHSQREYFTFTISLRKSKELSCHIEGNTPNTTDRKSNIRPTGGADTQLGTTQLGKKRQPRTVQHDEFEPEESRVQFGLFPTSDHTIGCPPRWPSDDSNTTLNPKIQRAVLRAQHGQLNMS